ncbi:MAG: hypothetical protein ACLRZH_05525 [Ruthenibacterium lactatiformans]
MRPSVDDRILSQRHTAWADAQKVNGIAPQDVWQISFEACAAPAGSYWRAAVVAYNDV